MPSDALDVSVAGEWSFAQTLRHLVLATDTWLGKAVLELEQPFHPLGLRRHGRRQLRPVGLHPAVPTYAEVLEARAGRVAMVRDFLATHHPRRAGPPRRNPHAPDYEETTLTCLHVILEEEWEHLRYALRDLETIEGQTDA